MKIFSAPIENDCIEFDIDVDIFEDRAIQLMRMAIGHGLEAGVMLVFSKAIRSGMNISEALDFTFESYPQLNQ